MVQRGRIVGSITRHGDDLAGRFEQLDETQFVVRTAARQNLQFQSRRAGLGVCHRGEIGTVDERFRRFVIGPQTDLPRNFARRVGVVARHNFHGDSGALTGSDRVRRFRAHGILDGNKSQPRQVLGELFQITAGTRVIVTQFECKAKRAHAAQLKRAQRLVQGFAPSVQRFRTLCGQDGFAALQYNFGRAFNMNHPASTRTRLDQGTHEFVLRRKWKALDDRVRLAQGVVIAADAFDPQQQRALSWISKHAPRGGRRGEIGGAVCRDGLKDQIASHAT